MYKVYFLLEQNTKNNGKVSYFFLLKEKKLIQRRKRHGCRKRNFPAHIHHHSEKPSNEMLLLSRRICAPTDPKPLNPLIIMFIVTSFHLFYMNKSIGWQSNDRISQFCRNILGPQMMNCRFHPSNKSYSDVSQSCYHDNLFPHILWFYTKIVWIIQYNGMYLVLINTKLH